MVLRDEGGDQERAVGGGIALHCGIDPLEELFVQRHQCALSVLGAVPIGRLHVISGVETHVGEDHERLFRVHGVLELAERELGEGEGGSGGGSQESLCVVDGALDRVSVTVASLEGEGGERVPG